MKDVCHADRMRLTVGCKVPDASDAGNKLPVYSVFVNEPIPNRV